MTSFFVDLSFPDGAAERTSLGYATIAEAFRAAIALERSLVLSADPHRRPLRIDVLDGDGRLQISVTIMYDWPARPA